MPLQIEQIKSLDYHVVVARYKEDVIWLHEMTPKLTIYNKGDRSTIDDRLLPFTCDLKNVGTEEYAYLHYIVANYEKLPDIVLFTQGDISDHKDVHVAVGSEAWLHRKKYVGTFVTAHTDSLSSTGILCDMIKQAHLYGVSQNAIVWTYNDGIPDALYGLTFIHKFTKSGFIITFGDWFTANVHEHFPCSSHLLWYKNALFAVSKSHILTRPKVYYQALILEIEKYETNILHFERSWYYIMNCHLHRRGWEEFTSTISMDSVWYPFNDPTKVHKFVNLYTLLNRMQDVNVLDVGGVSCEYAHFIMQAHQKATVYLMHKSVAFLEECLQMYPSRCKTLPTDKKLNIGVALIARDIELQPASFKRIMRAFSSSMFLLFDGITNMNVKKRVDTLISCGLMRPVNDIILEDYLGEAHHGIYVSTC